MSLYPVQDVLEFLKDILNSFYALNFNYSLDSNIPIRYLVFEPESNVSEYGFYLKMGIVSL